MKTTYILGYPNPRMTMMCAIMPLEDLESFLATIAEDDVLDVVEFDDGTEPMVDLRYYIHAE